MKQVRRILAVIISLAIVVAAIPAMSAKLETKAAANFVITSPEEGKLVAAGHFDIKWSGATDASVKSYKVYLDEKEVGQTTSTSLDCYTTKVEKHTAYVVAEYIDGTESTTPTITFYVTKKGLAVNNEMGRNLDPLNMNMAWYYTWGTNSFSYTTYKYAEFVPMKWGAGNEESVLNEIAKKNYKYLLGYNEPDMGGDVGGSNMSVATAVNNWNKFVGKSQFLGAPAPALSPSWGTGESDGGWWFRSFMNQIDQSTIDFIPLHCYYSNYGGAAGANTFLKEVVDATYEMYHKPIWITEFAVSGWGYSNESARKSVQEFMYTVIDGLNQRDYVERYSWFSFNTTDEKNGASALWTNATGELTDLGKIYAFYGNPEGYEPPQIPEPSYTFSSAKRTTPYTDTLTINGISCDNYINADGVSVTASSDNGNAAKAEFAIDGQIGTRWESKHKIDPQTITIDLGTSRNIKRINVLWENAGAKDYNIEVSADGTTWTNIADIEGVSGMQNRNDTIVLKNLVNAQYIKITGTARTTEYGYSIWEMAVYGTDNEKVDETKPVETTTRPVITKPDIPTEPPKPTVPIGDTTTKILESVETTAVPISGETLTEKNTVTTTKKLGTAKIKKATKKVSAKKVKITLKRIEGAQKYQIQISKTKKFKKKLVKKTVKKVKFTLTSKKIKNKKKLYVRARAMKVVDKKKYYGAWSKAKKIRIKK